MGILTYKEELSRRGKGNFDIDPTAYEGVMSEPLVYLEVTKLYL